MKLVIFGLTISSSWGNGHATIWRGLCKGLAKRGHEIVFFEKDVPYYASHRDFIEFSGMKLIIYQNWEGIRELAAAQVENADVGIITSYCPDAQNAANLVINQKSLIKTFYDLDAPVTLQELEKGHQVPYIPNNGLSEFDIVLSYTGGNSIEKIKQKLGAKRLIPIYGCADPDCHRPVEQNNEYASLFSYLGTYSSDRQALLNMLFIEASKRLPEAKFILGGSLYPSDFPWTKNIWFMRHVPVFKHPVFYSSSKFTLNITRKAMADSGFCPSGRIFEAAACGVPIISDYWEGLETFFEPGSEILLANSTDEVIKHLCMPETKRMELAQMARRRILQEHTADHRVLHLEQAFSN